MQMNQLCTSSGQCILGPINIMIIFQRQIESWTKSRDQTSGPDHAQSQWSNRNLLALYACMYASPGLMVDQLRHQ